MCKDFSLYTDFVRIFSLVDITPFFSVLLLPKVSIILTNALNKNCIELNFLQKTQRAHVFISSSSRAKGHQIFVNFEILLTLGLNAAKSTDYIEKYFNQKLSKVIFPTKTSLSAYVFFLSSGSRLFQRFANPIPARYIFKMANFWKLLALLLGENDICAYTIRFL